MKKEIERLKRFPAFSADSYLRRNPDVASALVDPFEHALVYGAIEDRPVFAVEDLARAWGDAVARTAGMLSPSALEPASASEPCALRQSHITVFIGSSSTPDDMLLARVLVNQLSEINSIVLLSNETADPAADHGIVVVVAPHVFYTVGIGAMWLRYGYPRRSFAVNTAPIQTPEFSIALPFLLASIGLLDVCPQTVDLFCQIGMPARLLLPWWEAQSRWLEDRDLDHPLIRSLPPSARQLDFDPFAWNERPLDFAFFGRNTHRRGTFFGRHAAELARYRTFFYLAQGCANLLQEHFEWRAHGKIRGHVAGHSKITLIIAGDEFPHMDWMAGYQAMISGSVVVTDICPPHEKIRTGVHLFQESVRRIPELIRWLVDAPDGHQAAKVARAASFRVLNDEGESKTVGLLKFLMAK